MFQYSKDGAVVSVMLDTRRMKADGRYPVKIRVSYKRSRWYYSTGKDMTPEEWTALPTTKVRALVAVRKDIESSYQIVRSTVEGLATSGGFSFEVLNGRLKLAGTDTIEAAFEDKITAMRLQDRIGNMMTYQVVLKGIRRFTNRSVPIDGITVEWLRRYERFLRNEGKRQATIAIHLRTIRVVLNDAKRYGKITEAQYPFGRGRYEIQAGEGRKMALTLEQI